MKRIAFFALIELSILLLIHVFLKAALLFLTIVTSWLMLITFGVSASIYDYMISGGYSLDKIRSVQWQSYLCIKTIHVLLNFVTEQSY